MILYNTNVGISVCKLYSVEGKRTVTIGIHRGYSLRQEKRIWDWINFSHGLKIYSRGKEVIDTNRCYDTICNNYNRSNVVYREQLFCCKG